MAARVFTIGYEGREPPGLVAELLAAGVSVLVDVRELPLSRRRGFSKNALREAVEAAGIAYLHDAALGNPKPHRDAWKAGDEAAGRAGYLARIRGESAERVDALAELVRGGGVCLMCVERDPAHCHRALLAGALAERIAGLSVENL